MRPTLEGMEVSEEILKILADTCTDILAIGLYELRNFSTYKNKASFETYEISYDMPNILLQYGFTTIEELNQPSVLERRIHVPDDVNQGEDNQP